MVWREEKLVNWKQRGGVFAKLVFMLRGFALETTSKRQLSMQIGKCGNAS